MWYCSSISLSLITDGASPDSFWLRSELLALSASESLNVMSSSPRMPLSLMTAGRTWGGETGSTVMIIQSGRAKRGSRPSFSQSSSLMRLSTSRASSANISRSPCMSGDTPSPSSSFLAAGYLTLKLRPLRRTSGWGAPHPLSGVTSSLALVTSCLHIFLPLHTCAILLRRACGCLILSASRSFISFSSTISIPHLWHTHVRILLRIGRNPMWYTGETRLMCPM
mmetsp:Transcript_52152/g.127338  ORF Transcript_52152/g.127338 Transcript_52152/m.127338 type:complete len:224 (-) Transcript_52152:259-930(-)